MNDLSWLIYLADICDNLDWFFFWLMFFTIFGAIIWAIAGMIGLCDEYDGFTTDQWKAWRKFAYYLILPCFFFGMVVGSLVPAKETIYAIAASEMGESVLNSSTGNKAVGALNAWLDEQLEGTEEEPKKEEKSED